MDVHSKEQRSYNMAQIHSKDTKPELKVRKYLFSKGFRYKKNSKDLPGCPDIVLPKYKTIIFVNGCFWHGHYGCKYFVMPKSNVEFWKNKISYNENRDLKNKKELLDLGWNVITIWECELKPKTIEETLCSLVNKIKKNNIIYKNVS